MKVVVFTLGCKVNQYEGQAMISLIKEMGHQATDVLTKADAYIINTCSVTMEADKKSRQCVARVLRLNPKANIAICGCSSQNNYKQFADKPNVSIITGTSNKMAFVRQFMSDIDSNVKHNLVSEPPKVYEDDLHAYSTKMRGFIKIQDGCNNFCSYCIVPYLRGRSRSRSLTSIVNEVKSATANKEIILSGINISAYGADIGSNLTELITALKDIPVRKRLGSLECNVIDEDMLAAMKAAGFCDHFHLSLQSASNRVLKDMNRHYAIEEYFDKVQLIRKYFPYGAITTDVITGFPTESDDEFRVSKENIIKIGFADVHVFPYSERKGTVAAKMKQVDKTIRDKRAREIAMIANDMRRKFLESNLGRSLEVYVEESEGVMNVGYTSNYIKVYSEAPIGSMTKLKLTSLYRDGVKGE